MTRAMLLAVLLLPAVTLANPPRIMLIGDSIQSGTGLRRATNLPSHRLERKGVVVHNFASPGARMTSSAFLGMVEATTAVKLLHGFFGLRGLVVNLGTNDWRAGVDPTQFALDYRQFLDALPPVLPVVCLSPTWRAEEDAPNVNGDALQDFRDLIESVCTGPTRTYLDGRGAVPASLSHFPDGLHLNDRGARAMASFLIRELDALGWLP